MKSTEEILRMIGDLHEAQLAANDGQSDLWEIKKAIIGALHDIEVRDDLSPKQMPKEMHRKLEKIIRDSIFLSRLSEAAARHPECAGDIVKLETATLKDQAERGEPLRPLFTWRRALSFLLIRLRRFLPVSVYDFLDRVLWKSDSDAELQTLLRKLQERD
jgi:hypothetical protein